MTMGLLLVTMEPPPAMAEEFHDWYDTEHVPERLAVPGIRNATRWVCLHGWPRYLALYDLDSPSVMDSPAYRAVSGDRFSAWSRRILPRTLGRRRVVAEQVTPGDAEAVHPDRVATLVVVRYPRPPAGPPPIPGLLQHRSFRALADPAETWHLLALDRATPPDRVHDAVGELGGIPATLIGIYVPYFRATG